MTGVAIVGAGMTALGKFPEASVKSLTQQAVGEALKDAGLDISSVQAAWFSNSRQGLFEGQNGIRGQCALRPLGIGPIPITNVENACASGSTALFNAVSHIAAGFCDVALVVGAEKMYFPDNRPMMFRAFLGGTDIHRLEEFERKVAGWAQNLVPEEFTDQSQVQRSFFMDSYAGQARLHMQKFGTTRRQLAAVAAKNHWHSTMNPLAQYQHDMSIDEVLASRSISWPLTLPMCAPISDGAAALVLCSEKMARSLYADKAIGIRGISLLTGISRADSDFSQHIGRLAALDVYEKSGIEPTDIDVAEVHDATAYSEIQQIENLGLCPIGEGGSFSEAGHTRLGGKVPVNTSGGLISKGHPVGATGLMQIQELVAQLRHRAGKRQVPDARIGVAENGGGFYENEEATTVITVLEKIKC
ncbi:thiolase family protein [Lacimicrobium alkaliphilum]|uniref:propanoyl-CoA C-acyltransferase n=1 Tax=Lacimicrobium alkaliphilum TaxID=1526571 RepID=A0A0U2ZAC1_9ALTE|nr:thiolase family protein [Lacimicrobium alkaliphilum]ALS99875.1 thiolase [Lacimicrobium alkaliphilum]